MKKRLFALMHGLGLTRAAAWVNRGRVVILCYHGVTARRERRPDDPTGLHVRAERFEAQLDYLRRNYRVLPLGEYLAARREGRSLPPRAAVLTFDDGYRNFLTMAAPRLAARALPASVFLITEWVRAEGDGPPSRAWAEEDDVRGMTWAEIKELRAQGVEFGSHTCTHPRLPDLPAEEAERELIRSRDLIAEHLGGGAQGGAMPFAYPYGAYTPALAERARGAGYSCALTTDAGANDPDADLYELRRVLVGDGDDVPSFAARVSGLTAWLGRGLGAARGAGY